MKAARENAWDLLFLLVAVGVGGLGGHLLTNRESRRAAMKPFLPDEPTHQPTSAAGWVDLGRKWFQEGGLGQTDEVIDAFARAIAVEPTSARSWHLHGSVLQTLPVGAGDAEAVRSLTRALAIAPASGMMLHDRATVRQRLVGHMDDDVRADLHALAAPTASFHTPGGLVPPDRSLRAQALIALGQ